MAEQTKTTPPPVLGEPGELCCGVKHAIGNEGKPLILSCQLCPQASIYFRAESGFQERQRRLIIGGELPERGAG